jgi:hypothetical protein
VPERGSPSTRRSSASFESKGAHTHHWSRGLPAAVIHTFEARGWGGRWSREARARGRGEGPFEGGTVVVPPAPEKHGSAARARLVYKQKRDRGGCWGGGKEVGWSVGGSGGESGEGVRSCKARRWRWWDLRAAEAPEPSRPEARRRRRKAPRVPPLFSLSLRRTDPWHLPTRSTAQPTPYIHAPPSGLKRISSFLTWRARPEGD